MTNERVEFSRRIAASPTAVFAVLTDPAGHARIDSTGMLQWAEGERVGAVGDRFTVHMDREALGDRPMGHYDVDVVITALEPDRAIEWTIEGTVKPYIGHRYGYRLEPDGGAATLVSSYYDWSQVLERYRTGLFPVIPEASIRATLGILARTVESHADGETWV